MTSAALIREKATEDHRAAAREVATFLALFDAAALARLADALRHHLTDREAVCLAMAALRAVEPKDLPEVLQVLPEPPAGWPDEPFLIENVMAEAALWAVAAWPEERKAYAMAALAHMPEEERHAIVRALGPREAT